MISSFHRLRRPGSEFQWKLENSGRRGGNAKRERIYTHSHANTRNTTQCINTSPPSLRVLVENWGGEEEEEKGKESSKRVMVLWKKERKKDDTKYILFKYIRKFVFSPLSMSEFQRSLTNRIEFNF